MEGGRYDEFSFRQELNIDKAWCACLDIICCSQNVEIIVAVDIAFSFLSFPDAFDTLFDEFLNKREVVLDWWWDSDIENLVKTTKFEPEY